MAAPLTTGNLVIYRVGDGIATLKNTGNPVFLDEVTPQGELVQSVAMPTEVSGSHRRLVASGTASSDGLLSRSADGRYLVLTGYDADWVNNGIALSSVGSTAALINRVIGLVDGAGTMDTSTALSDANSGNNFRGVASVDGTAFWSAGGGSGLRYSLPGAATSTQISTASTSLRAVMVFQGQLYASGTSSGLRLVTVGNGLPTAASTAMAALPGYPADGVSPNAFFLCDLSAQVEGIDTLYVADDLLGLAKYCLELGQWTARGRVGNDADDYRGIAGRVRSGQVELFASRKGGGSASGGGELVSLADGSGHGAQIVASPTLLRTAAGNTAFRGVAFTSAGDLSIALSLPATAKTTAAFEVSLGLRNEGMTEVASANARLSLPEGLAFVSGQAEGFQVSQVNGVVQFTGGRIAAGSQANLRVHVAASQAGALRFAAAAASADALGLVDELNEANNDSAQSSELIVSDAPDLVVSATAPAISRPARFAYELVVRNQGLLASPPSQVALTLPAGLSLDAAGSVPGLTAQGALCQIPLAALQPGAQVNLRVMVEASQAGSYTLPSSAVEVDPENSVSESHENNNRPVSEVITEVGAAILQPSLLSHSLSAGESGSLSLTLVNRGLVSTAGEMTLRVLLPVELSLIRATGQGWGAVSQDGAWLRFTRSGSLGAGQSAPALLVEVATGYPLASPLNLSLAASGGGSDEAEVPASLLVLNAGAGSLGLEVSRLDVNEEEGRASVRILRQGGWRGAASVLVSTRDAQVGPRAVAGTDYTAIQAQRVEFAQGERSRMLEVAIRADASADSGEGFEVHLHGIDGAQPGGRLAMSVVLWDRETSKPSLKVLSPVANSRTEQSPLQLAVAATDNVALRGVQYALNGGPWQELIPQVQAGPKEPNFTASMTPRPGPNRVEVRATDYRGNREQISQEFIHVRRAPIALELQPQDLNPSVLQLTPTHAPEALELGMPYRIEARPPVGRRFDRWITPQGEVESPRLEFTMSEGLKLTARFVNDPFANAAVVGGYEGLVGSVPGGVASHDNQGWISLKLEPSGSFSGLLRLAGLSRPLVGSIHPGSGQARFGPEMATTLLLPRGDQTSLLLSLEMNLSGDAPAEITGLLQEQTATGAEPLAVLQASRLQAQSEARTLNLALKPGSLLGAVSARAGSLPTGDGVGQVSVSARGSVQLAAVLADGSSVLASASLNTAGGCALYAPLYEQRGALRLGLGFDDAAQDTDCSGTALWFRPHQPVEPFEHGWPEGLSLPVIGARYALAAGQALFLGLDLEAAVNASLELAGASLPAPLRRSLWMGLGQNVIARDPSDSGFTASLNAAMGRLSGQFSTPQSGRLTYRTVLLQKGANARGFGHFVDAQGAGSARLSYSTVPQTGLMITELMAKNETGLRDEDGAFSDWIELYNSSNHEMDLTDWCLTDNPSLLSKWRFPSLRLAPRSFVVVFASSKNRRSPGAQLHTNFNLSADGEYLALVRPDGVSIEQEFAPAFPALRDDESYGLQFVSSTPLIAGAKGRYLVPNSAAMGLDWTALPFKDSSWREGATGMGFGMSVPGMTVRMVAAAESFGGLGSLARVDALLGLADNDSRVRQSDTRIRPVLNILGEGGDGHYGNNEVLPLAIPDNYAVSASGEILIPRTGSYVFGLNSDDGGRIRIDGRDVMVDDSVHGPEDHLSAPLTLTAGLHRFEVVMWEDYGGDEVEFYAGPGNAAQWTADMQLVGSPNGLQVFTTAQGGSAPRTAGGSVATNVEGLMRNQNAGLYLRLPFSIDHPTALTGLTLRLRYNDGFIAYLNGSEVARSNAPDQAVFNSSATAARDVGQSQEDALFDLTAHLPLLRAGRNVLAIHALNVSAADDTFLIRPQLEGLGALRTASASRFAPQDGGIVATPGESNPPPRYVGRVAPIQFSASRGFKTAPFALALSCATSGASIRYTLDGSTPDAATGRPYTGPISIARTSIVRAVATKPGFEPSAVTTQTHLFVNDIIQQQPTGARPSSAWPQPGSELNGQVMDYGMDPAVVRSSDPAIGGEARLKAALQALPCMSLVTDSEHLFDPATGIHVNPWGRGAAWERPASLELIGDSGPGGGFQINCGVRTRGGFSRSGDNPKHAFRFYFRTEYAGDLRYPLFGGAGASRFERMDLRTAQNYSWSFGGDGNNTFIREEISRELQGAMGQPHGRGRYYHLFLNGVYWGLFDTQERTEAFYGETYLGGEEEDYDVVKGEQDAGYTTGVTDGNLEAWTDLWTQCRAHAADPSNARYFAMQGLAPDGVTRTTSPVLLDVDNLIDYLMLSFWTGNFDGCTSAFLGDRNANNWYGMRNRLGLSGGFKFFAHDFEHSFFDPQIDRTGPFPNGEPENFSLSNPFYLHHDLRGNAEYRMRWADRVQQHLFGQGALTALNVQRRIDEMAARIDTAIIAESARWGDSKRGPQDPPLTRLDWLGAVEYLRRDFVPRRADYFLPQLREDGLFPSLAAPQFSRPAGTVPQGVELSLSGEGTLHYTTDGTDPRLVGGGINPAAQVYRSNSSTEILISSDRIWRYLDDGSDQATAWRALDYDDSAWKSGRAELGYGDGDEVTVVGAVDADPGLEGLQRNATTYFRTAFDLQDLSGITALTLRLKVDDGALVYLNGIEAARTENMAWGASFDQFSSGAVADENAMVEWVLDPAALRQGSNVLAVEVHQSSAQSSDISLQAEMELKRFAAVTPLRLTQLGQFTIKTRAQSQQGEWSALNVAQYQVVTAADLRVRLSLDSALVIGGNRSRYELRCDNVGSAPFNAAGRALQFQAPPGLSIVAVAGEGWNAQISTDGLQASMTRNDVLAPAAAFPVLQVMVSPGAQIGNTAAVTATLLPGDGNPANDCSTLISPVYGEGTQQLFLLDAARPLGVEEEAGAVVLTVRRRGLIKGAVSLRVRTLAGKAKAGEDFVAINDQLVEMGEGELSATIEVGIVNDGRSEGHEEFRVELHSAQNAGLGEAQRTVMILDPDTQAPRVSIDAPAANAPVFSAAVDGRLSALLSARDNFGVRGVECSLDNGPFLPAEPRGAAWGIDFQAAPGPHVIRARAQDFRGNVSPVISRSLEVQTGVVLALSQPDAAVGSLKLQPGFVAPNLVGLGRALRLTAVPAKGQRFDHWSTSWGEQTTNPLEFTPLSDCSVQAHFVADPFSAEVTGRYEGLVLAATGITRSSANHGLLSVLTTRSGTWSGRLMLDGVSLPLVGLLDNRGGCLLRVPRRAQPALTLRWSSNWDQGPSLQAAEQKFTGTLDVEGRDAPLALGQLVLWRIPATAAAPGQLSLRLPAAPLSALNPTGSGSGSLRWTANRGTSLVLRLADGSGFTAAGWLNGRSSVAVFAPLYRGRGGFSALLGTRDLPDQPGLLCDEAWWLRPVQPSSPTLPFGWPQGLRLEIRRDSP